MMKIIILEAGRYNDLFLTANDCEPGQVLETHDWYGEELVKKGIAEEIPGTALKSKAQMPKRTEVDITPSRKTGSTSAAPKPSSAPKPTSTPKPAAAAVQQPLTVAPIVSDAENSANIQPTGEGTPAGESQETQGDTGDGQGNESETGQDDTGPSDGDEGQTE
jgi:hypothetical protein